MKIIIVDDDHLVCQSLKTIIEISSAKDSINAIRVIAIGHNGEEAIALYGEHRPDILLMDIRMDTLNGIDAGKAIRALDPEAKILYLTTFLDDEYIINALQLGAKGYLLKTSFESILPALYAVSRGQRVFGDEIVEKIPAFIETKKSLPDRGKLSEKEWNIVEYVAQGLNNKEIAAEAFLSEGTVRNYISVILEKLDLRDRTQLAIYYYKNT